MIIKTILMGLVVGFFIYSYKAVTYGYTSAKEVAHIWAHVPDKGASEQTRRPTWLPRPDELDSWRDEGLQVSDGYERTPRDPARSNR